MKLTEICSSLPQEWLERGNCRAPKRLSVVERRNMLDSYKVGLMRLKEMHLSVDKFTQAQINDIGISSIHRKKIVVGKEGGAWTVVSCSRENCAHFRHHGYVVHGRKVTPLFKSVHGTVGEILDRYESMDRSKPLNMMKAEEVFNAGKGVRTRKKVSVSAAVTFCKRDKNGIAKSVGGTHKRDFCGHNDESVIVEHRNKAKRGERVHMRALARKAKTVINI